MARGKQEKSEFVSGLGKAFEFVKAISDNVRTLGGNDGNLRAVLNRPDLLREVAKVIMEQATGKFFPCQILAADLIPEYTDDKGNTKKWEVLEDVIPSVFDVSKLKPAAFLKDDDGGWISWDEMRKRATALVGCNLGLVDGKKMLDEQDKIPAELRDFYIPLPGTVLRVSDGSLYVPYLYWRGGRWFLGFSWQGYGWNGCSRFACSE